MTTPATPAETEAETKFRLKLEQSILTGQRLVSMDARLTAVATEALAAEGYMSKILRCQLTWSVAKETLPKTVVVKLPLADNMRRLMASAPADGPSLQAASEELCHEIKNAHNDECRVYELLAGQTRVPIPNCLAAVPLLDDQPPEEGMIILEDLTKKVVGCRSVAEPLNLERARNVLSVLADLHAWSAERHRSDSRWMEKVPRLSDRMGLYKNIYTLAPDMIQSLKEQHPVKFDDLCESEMTPDINNQKLVETFDIKENVENMPPVVLVHGDVQPMNLLFHKDRPNELAALIDWQLSHKGYGVEDVARLVAACLNSDTRRQGGAKLLHEYVELYNGKVKHTDLKITYNQVKPIFDAMLGMIALMFALAGCFVAEIFHSHIEDPEKKKCLKEAYIQSCYDLYDDAMRLRFPKKNVD